MKFFILFLFLFIRINTICNCKLGESRVRYDDCYFKHGCKMNDT